jgi:hypothetical protein
MRGSIVMAEALEGAAVMGALLPRRLGAVLKLYRA